jgi:hypothetical protein
MAIAKQSHPLESPQALLRVTKHLDIPPRRKILRTISTGSFAVQDELDKARGAWEESQSTRRRDAIYGYLSVVFEIVRRWEEQDCVQSRVHQALKATGRRIPIQTREPFGVVLICTSDVDTKTRSKWSRALRFAERALPDAENLSKFMKRLGGINECADRFSNRAR